jgi:spore maturation protein SpmA/spore maturation protein SpmB
MINIIWGGMFLIAVLVAFFKLAIEGNVECFNQIVQAIFNSASSAVDISIGLIGILSFWLGILRLIEKTGIAETISHKLSPLFRIIMKDIPSDSPAISTVVLNMSANFLGLDNAATPMGLKAMEQLQEYNKQKDTASDAQILFMILNASSVTLIPITIFMYRAKLGATYPTEVFIPILLATSVSTLVGFLLVAIKQKISLSNPILLKWLISFAIIIVGLSALFLIIPADKRLLLSSGIGNIILVLLLGYIILKALKCKLSSYELFIDGAKEGFFVAINILPYLVSMLVAIAVFRACGILDIITDIIKLACTTLGIDNSFVDALPVAFMKPLSGSGARAMMIETMQNYGANSFASFVASVVQGSTETTFYVLTVYFGAVKISKMRYALKYALISDLAGITAAIVFSYMFYNM